MAISSQLLTTKSKKQQIKQTSRTKQNHRYGDHLEGYQLGGRRVEWVKRLQGLKSTNW